MRNRDKRFWAAIIIGIILMIAMSLILWPEGSDAHHRDRHKRGSVSLNIRLNFVDYTVQYRPWARDAADYLGSTVGQRFAIDVLWSEQEPLDYATCSQLPYMGVINICEDYSDPNAGVVAVIGATGWLWNDEQNRYVNSGGISWFYPPYNPDGSLSGYNPVNVSRHEFGHAAGMGHNGICSPMVTYDPNCQDYEQVNYDDVARGLSALSAMATTPCGDTSRPSLTRATVLYADDTYVNVAVDAGSMEEVVDQALPKAEKKKAEKKKADKKRGKRKKVDKNDCGERHRGK
jgi:hypothetical protein